MQRPGDVARFAFGKVHFLSRFGVLPRLLALALGLLGACGEAAGDHRDASIGPINMGPGPDAGQPGPSGPGAVADAAQPGPSVDSSAPLAEAAVPDSGSALDASPSDGSSPAGDSGGSVAAEGGTGPLTGPFPPVTDFTKNGPFTSTTLMNTGPNGGYTVYLPTMLAPNGAKNPIIGWMSGGGTTHDLYPMLPRLATQGFVVVAANVAPGIGDEANLGKQIIAGIDWAIAENGRSGSMLFDKLNTTKIASMGYSMGSLATFMIAGDARLTTTVHISGGNMAAERIQNLKQPAIFICGTPGPSSCGILDSNCDIAAANCDTDFAMASTPVFYANFAGGHLGVLVPPTEDSIGGLAAAWLRWKLMDDRTLDRKFLGDNCEVCKDMLWSKVQRKNL